MSEAARSSRRRTMTLEGLSRALLERAQMRAVYAKLADECDAVLISPPPARRHKGSAVRKWSLGVPGSLLSVPAVSLPLLETEQLPLGLQVMDFAERMAAVRHRSLADGAAWG
jgi:hypothetical protein